MPHENSDYIPLAQAVDRYRQEPGAYSNAYDWYRKSAQRHGYAWIAGVHVPAVKQGRQWMVTVSDLESALTAHRAEQARRKQVAEDYETHILHGEDGAQQKLPWGGYRIRGVFHFVWNDMDVYRRSSDGSWRCNACWAFAKKEHNNPECHTCSDWNGCGGDCTLSRIFCETCGTSLNV